MVKLTLQTKKPGFRISDYIYVLRYPSFLALLSFSHIAMSFARSVPSLFRDFTSSFGGTRTFPRKGNWYRNIAQPFSTANTSPNLLSQTEKHARPAQFPPVQNLSPRIPNRSAQFNNADQIEQYLHEDGHRAWGFVIYRCTYESNTAWEEFMRRLLANTE